MAWHSSIKLALVGSVAALAILGLACNEAKPAAAPATPTATTAQDKAAMEAKAMAEQKAMDEKAAMEAKAMAEKKAMEEKAAMEKSGDAMMEKTDSAMMKLPDQQFAAHFVDSAPKHGTTFTQTPDKVVLNFNFTLTEASTITVSKDGAMVATTKPTFSANKLMMSAPLPANTGKGLYQVDYKACWPDNSCHNGRFAFTVG